MPGTNSTVVDLAGLATCPLGHATQQKETLNRLLKIMIKNFTKKKITCTNSKKGKFMPLSDYNTGRPHLRIEPKSQDKNTGTLETTNLGPVIPGKHSY